MLQEKILYVSDLDGTLLQKNGTLSRFTVETINRLIEDGMAFTFATARSIQSAKSITKDLKLRLPVITRNGSVFADHGTEAILEKAVFLPKDVALLKKLLPMLPYCGFVSSYDGDVMNKNYCSGKISFGLQKYVLDHKDDKRMRMITDPGKIFCEQPGYVTMIDEEKNLRPTYEILRSHPNWECVLQKDTYGEEYWLEICPKDSTKAKAILSLKNRLGFEKIIVFGDSVNDLSMFQIADEAYAVDNAMKEIKQAATAVIQDNDQDAVAKFLLSRFSS